MTLTKSMQHRIRFGAALVGLWMANFCPQIVAAQEAPAPQQESSPLGNPNDIAIKRTPKLSNAEDPYYPCDDCHTSAEEYNTTPRELEEDHGNREIHFEDTDDGWCHKCHKAGNYLKLQLQNGKDVTFNEAYMLCRQCHGPEYKDWKKNAHGKRTGLWQGPRQVYSCPECHDPHRPPFKSIKATNKPVKPEHDFWRY